LTIMAKTSMFSTLGRRYPEFNNLSTNHFSDLNRMNEIYPIVRKLREDYPAALNDFASYPTVSSKDLGQKIFSFVKNNLN